MELVDDYLISVLLLTDYSIGHVYDIHALYVQHKYG